MRRKRHLDKRLEDCGEILLRVKMQSRDASKVEAECYIELEKVFGNANPFYLEIGAGKGAFARELATRNPNVNIIAVEMLSNVIVSASEQSDEKKTPNLRFLCVGAEYLMRYIKPKSVSRIYLNFSTPYPKSTYANNRLTHDKFIAIYKNILVLDGEIHQKTDSKILYEYSKKQYREYGFDIFVDTLDLHHENTTDNIVTEYEEKFISEGKPIYCLKVKLCDQLI